MKEHKIIKLTIIITLCCCVVGAVMIFCINSLVSKSRFLNDINQEWGVELNCGKRTFVKGEGWLDGSTTYSLIQGVEGNEVLKDFNSEKNQDVENLLLSQASCISSKGVPENRLPDFDKDYSWLYIGKANSDGATVGWENKHTARYYLIMIYSPDDDCIYMLEED